jgi:hypothetical protein
MFSRVMPLRNGIDGRVIYLSYSLQNAAGATYSAKACIYFPLAGDPLYFDSSESFLTWYSERLGQRRVLPIRSRQKTRIPGEGQKSV